MRIRAAAACAGLLLFCTAAHAHEVLHTIERGKAIAVKAYFADGEVLAYTEVQVFSPADAKIPYQKGRTDRAGYVAFVPDVPGPWHVRITDSSGHGLDLDVPVDRAGQPATPRSSAVPASWAFALRPVLGVALIAALFGVLVVVYRRRGAKR